MGKQFRSYFRAGSLTACCVQIALVEKQQRNFGALVSQSGGLIVVVVGSKKKRGHVSVGPDSV